MTAPLSHHPVTGAGRGGSLTRTALAVLVALSLVGCGGDEATQPPEDVVVSDVATVADTRDQDDGQPAVDTSLADIALPDAMTDDAAADDVTAPDTATDTAETTTDRTEDATPTTLWLSTLTTEADYDALVLPPGDLKFLAYTADAARTPPLTEACTFQNMAVYAYHIHFLKSFEPFADLTPPGYVTLVMRRETRTFWGGGVRFNPTLPHPTTGAPGVLHWSIAAEETALESITIDDLVAADAALAPCIPAYAARRAFSPSTDAQRSFVTRNAAALTAAGLAFVE